MENTHGYIVMENGTVRNFKAVSPKMAIMAAQKVLGLRSMTKKCLKKAKAVSVFFGFSEGKVLKQIYPKPASAKSQTKARRKDWNHQKQALVEKHFGFHERSDDSRRRGVPSKVHGQFVARAM